MSDTHNSQQHTPSKEDNAFETANTLLLDAIESLQLIMARHVDTPAKAIMAGSHAITAKLDSLESSLCSAMQDLKSSMANPASALERHSVLTPTDQEAEVIIAALKAAWLRRNPVHTENEYVTAMRRFEILAGL